MKLSRVGKSMVCLLSALILCLGRESRADFKALIQEIEGYRPPSVVASQLQALPVSPPPLPSASESAFQAQVASLQQRQEKWLQSLSEPGEIITFYVPDPVLLARLRPAVTDPTVATKALAQGLTLETLETLVLLRNPAIQAKESEFKAVLEGYSQAENLDTILRRYASLTKSLMTGVGGMTNPDPVALKFPFPGVLALKGEIVNQEALAAREEFEIARREALTSVRKDFAELLYARKALEISQSLLQLIDNMRRTALTRYQAGAATFQEVTGIDIERERAKDELLTLGDELHNIETAIRTAILLPEEVVVGVPIPPDRPNTQSNLETLYQLALKRRQEIRLQEAMLGRMERMLEMSETMIYPGFTPGLSFYEGDEVSARGGESTAQASFGAELPKTPWFGTNDAYLRQTRQRLNSLNKALEATRASTMLEVRTAWFRFDKAKRQEALYRDRIVPLSQASLDAASQGYSTGSVTFAELIGFAKGWLTDTLSLARAQADVLKTTAELEAAVGISSGNFVKLK